ncbi:MFS transporter [Paenibacillus sp. NEAU-GSW1]|nr:MFS transporter [Paenibacillus sp. NEAU-GSW1]MUT65989.1 MFS transporter [Paenibacillus sp. NEAU-GSW1]
MRLISVILFIVEFVRGAVLISLLPIYGQKNLGLSLDIIGVAITAHYLTDTLLKMAIGYLLDRFSIRFVVQIGLLLSLLGVFLFQFAETGWLFIAASALYGIGMSPIWIVCLTKVTSDQRATQMGFLYTIWFVGLGSGPIVCNILLDYNAAFTYYLLLALATISWLLSFFMSSARANDLKPIPIRDQFTVLASQLRQMRLLLPGMILQTAGASMLVPVLPSFAEKHLGIPGAQYSLLLTLGGIFAAAGMMPMGRLSDKLDSKKSFLVFGFFIFAFGLYVLALKLPFWYCLIIAIALGLSYAAILPSWNALLAAYVPPKQEGLGWGILSTIEGLGVMIGPLAGGFIAASYGEPSVVWISAVLFALIGLFYLFLPSKVLSGSSH